jgi:hypothetical protein
MDPVSAARTARESLARGLAALQSPGVPPQLLTAADPVAQAMGALHRIESTAGAALPEAAPMALGFVRQALAALQAQPFQHPAIDQGMEAIAGSLGIVHQLAHHLAPATQPAQAAYGQPPAYSGYGQPAPHAPPPQAAYNPPVQQPYAQPPQPAYGHPPAAPNHGAGQPVSPFAGTLLETPAYVPGQNAPPPNTQPSRNLPHSPRPEPQPRVEVVSPGASTHTAGTPAARAATQHWDQPPAAPQNPQNSTLASAGQVGVQRVEAALGAHSTTNFYKGLSGNDVIESGGIFVATYQIPTIGSNVLIHVSLPGGYEFEAAGVVRWTREAPGSGSDSPPGFGAQFTQISPEGRQLVYRYVRNREPLFHDDF